MHSVEAAEACLEALAMPLSLLQDRERVGLAEAPGRILAETVTSDLDFPHWDNSAMDGYAIRYVDVQGCGPEEPVELDLVGTIAAGEQPRCSVGSRQAARIFTGAMVPPGADTIVMQENTQYLPGSPDRVRILQAPAPQAFVRRQGAYYRAGQPLFSPGIELQARDIAVLAALQCSSVWVYRPLRVALLSTGNELVSPDRPLQAGQIVDSNQYALAALVKQMGMEPILWGIVPDDPDRLQATIAQAVEQADVVVSSGGVSVGDYDYVEQCLMALGATLHIRAVAMKPGKPLTVATVPVQSANQNRGQGASTSSFPAAETACILTFSPASTVLYFGLPGNPVSALVSFWRFVQPALRKMSGLTSGYAARFVQGETTQTLKSGGQRETYLWGRVDWQDDRYYFTLAGGDRSSGNLINLAQTNALAVIPIGQEQIAAGESVKILMT